MSAPNEPTAPATTGASGLPPAGLPGLPEIDVNEYGGRIEGERQVLGERLFMQLLVYRTPPSQNVGVACTELAGALARSDVRAVIYDDTNDPRSIGLLTFATDPAHFVKRVRPIFDRVPLSSLELRADMTMLGRSYSTGHEPNLRYSLLERPIDNAMHPDWAWAIWYPLRRSGAFAQLEPKEQSRILREHASIGLAYGKQDLAHDVRLACHGLDANDNEFVVGLVGKELHPLSHVIQTMRKTEQTSQYIAKMGPFFVGHVRART